MATFSLLNDIKRTSRAHRLERETVTTLYGNVTVSFLNAPLESGDHTLRIVSFGGSVKLRLPEHVGVEIDGFTMVSQITIETLSTNKEESADTPWTSENFVRTDVRVYIQVIALFGEIEIMRVPIGAAEQPATPQIAESFAPTGFERGYEGETTRLGRL